ncbi:MAG: MFS transporter [Gammaproteobacteria bacterium]
MNHAAFAGSRVAVPLGALELGASTFTIGLLLSFYGLLPMCLSVSSGRWIDRVGMRTPMIAGSSLVAFGVAVPFLAWDVGAMFLASVTVGVGFMAFQVAVQKALGILGGPEARTANFSLLALGYSISGFLGPTMAGVGIDLVGHRGIFAALACTALVAVLALLRFPFSQVLPRPLRHVAPPDAAPARLIDLLGTPELKRLYVSVTLLSSAWDVHQFLVPLYGASIGLSASMIGLVLGAFSVATFIVRLALPWIARRVSEWRLILGAMVAATLVYLVYPFFPAVPPMLALSFLLGLGLGTAQPVMLVLLHRISPQDRIGEAVGLRMMLINGTQTFLPSTFGAFAGAFGLAAIFWGMAMLIGAGAWYAAPPRKGGRPEEFSQGAVEANELVLADDEDGIR